LHVGPPISLSADGTGPRRIVVRIVSLTCSNTEIVAALGLGEQLVGVDDHSDWPADLVARLPRVGPDLSIDVDAVVRLEPDLVLASLTVPGHEAVVEACDRAGLPWIAPEPVSLADVARDVRDIALRCGVGPRGEEVAAAFEAAMPAVDADLRPRVLVEWWPKPVIVPCRLSWVTDLLDLAGGLNPFAERDAKSTPVTDDEVIAARPDAVVLCWCGVPFGRYRPDVVYRREPWRHVPALEREQVHLVAEAFLGRPGPRLVDGYRALRAVVAAAAAAIPEDDPRR
jgi:iron complex transport system substrate-binding protein